MEDLRVAHGVELARQRGLEANAPPAEPEAATPDESPSAVESTGALLDDKEPSVSTTDAEARVMKMADGGFRPALYVQFISDTASGVIELPERSWGR